MRAISRVGGAAILAFVTFIAQVNMVSDVSAQIESRG